ncbi:MAG: TonB-dependent receptor [Mangrovibacterium sp.]
MKKKVWDYYTRERIFPGATKILLKMKLTLIMFLLSFLGTIASETYSQTTRLSLELKNETVENVLGTIEEKSEFYFLYSAEMIDVNRKVNINVLNSPVEKILDLLFEGTGITYTVKGRQVVLSSGKDLVAQQQPRTISGKVTDSSGSPLPGVTVVVKGTTQGTITATDGNYSFTSIPADAILVFSFVGMRTQEMPVAGKTNINVVMKEDAIGIKEVVAVGYGTKAKETLTGSISVIDNEVLESRSNVKATDLLQGVSSGIQISRTNTGDIRSSTNSITIRGVTSRNAPGVLVVVDGIAQNYTDSRALDNINPNDIENISILKDGSAAIYGARAAGGVILVTTKAGKTNKPTINLSAMATIQSPSLMRHTMHVLDVTEMHNEGFVNDGQPNNPFTPVINYIRDNNITREEINKNNGKWILTAPWDAPNALGYWDWADIMFDPSLQQNYNVSISGKTDKLNYYESVNYVNQDGMLAYGSNYKKRLLLTLKNDYVVNSFLKIKSNFSLGNQKIVEPMNYSSNSYNGGVQGALFFVWPTNQPFTAGGHYMNQGGFHDPIGYAEAAGNRTDLSYILHGNLGVEITPFKDFVITAEISSNYDILESDWASIGFPMYNVYDEFTQYSSDDANTGPNRAGADFTRSRYSLGNFYARYTYNKLANHKIDLMAGYSHEENDYRSFSAYRRLGLISAQLPTMAVGSTSEQYNSEAKSDYALNSVFSRLEYSFKNRYLFEGIFRYDGSSKFAEGHKWAPFYGLEGGWILSEESFFKNLNEVIDFMKIRGSWGELGNQTGIGLYDYLSQVNIGGGYPMGSYISPVQVQNATLGGMASATRSWEKIESKNIGIDFSLLNSRLSGSFDTYIKDNKNMFFVQEFPQVLGTTAPSINGAHIRTKGWELELGWRDKVGQFDYFVKLNLQNNHNKVVSLADAVIPAQGTNTFVQGYPANSYFGLKYEGLIQTDEELAAYTSSFTSGLPNTLSKGDARFKDMDGDGKLEKLPYTLDEDGKPTDLSGDLVHIGDGGQHGIYGITLGASWKNFDFTSFFQGVLNWQVVNTTVPGSQYFEPIESYYLHQTWSTERTDAPFPRLSQNGPIKTNNYQYSDAPYKIWNNRYIRLKNIQLGYTLPKRITDKLNMDKLRVYFSGTDIWEHTTLPGNQDPETPFAIRVSPFPRQYSFGLNLTF